MNKISRCVIPSKILVFLLLSLVFAFSHADGLEVDVDRFGMDYRRIVLPAADPTLCQSECRSDTACKSFTYVKPGLQAPGPVCYLKNGQPNPTPNTCCISGVVSNHPDPIGDMVISFLAVNLLEVYNYHHGSDGVPWRERYNRIIRWMKNTQTFPDIIALQEANGFVDCPTDRRRMPDYAALDFLLDGIRSVSGEQYRIAYFGSEKEGGLSGYGWHDVRPAQFCSGRGGSALLYRPSRVRNVIVRPQPGDTLLAFDNKDIFPPNTPILLKSLPCCFPASDRKDVCNVIDGALEQSSRCDDPTAIGAVWTARRLFQDQQKQDAYFSRFQLVNQPSLFFHVYNVHLRWDLHPGDQSPDAGIALINNLVNTMESRFNPKGDTLYPPLLIGDFNLDSGRISTDFPRFRIAMWSPEVMGALVGLDSEFPAKQKAFIKLQQNLPQLHGIEQCDKIPYEGWWSDHCAIFFRVEPIGGKPIPVRLPISTSTTQTSLQKCLKICTKEMDDCMANAHTGQERGKCAKEYENCKDCCSKECI